MKKIRICMGTSGISAGAKEILNKLEGKLTKHGLENDYEIIKAGDRGLFNDVILDIEDENNLFIYENVNVSSIGKIVEQHLLQGKPVEELLAGEDYRQFFASQKRIILKNCGIIDPENIEHYIHSNGYEALKKSLSITPHKVLLEIKKSELRGRGGAGFPTAIKWENCMLETSAQKYIVCNADEGDPGAFMDRSLLEGDPHSVLEGMIIAGFCIGADEGYIYCRAEYPLAIKRIKKAIEDATNAGFLGKNIDGSEFSFKINVIQGAGAFVCGEETSLLNSIEGKRGVPGFKPPYPAEKGLWNMPTCLNNVETFANIRHVIINGGEWFKQIGSENSSGTKVFAVTGKVKNTGLIEVPMGTTINDLIKGPAGGMINPNLKCKAVQIGGPSGGCIPFWELDTPIDYEAIKKTGSIMGSGGLVVMDEGSCMVDVAKYFLSFSVEESCGKCVPCRVGLKRMLDVLNEVTEGRGTDEHLHFLQEMSDTVKSTAFCGLGGAAPNPIVSTVKYFNNEYSKHIQEKKCDQKICEALFVVEIDKVNCVACGKCKTICPVNAINWKKGEKAFIKQPLCIKCKACISVCPVGAII